MAPARDNTSASVRVWRISRPRLAPSAERTASSRIARGATRRKQAGHVGAGDQQNGEDSAQQDPRRRVCILHLTVAHGADLQMKFLSELRWNPKLRVPEERLHLSPGLAQCSRRVSAAQTPTSDSRCPNSPCAARPHPSPQGAQRPRAEDGASRNLSEARRRCELDDRPMSIVLFSTLGSRLKRLNQKPSEISATLGPLGRSSSGKKLRPSSGEIPSVGRNDCATWRALKVYRVRLGQIACVHASLKGHGREGLLVVAPFVKETAQRELLLLERLHQAYRDKPVVVRIGQAAKQNPIDHAEDRCGGADAERQSGDGGDRKDRIARNPRNA